MSFLSTLQQRVSEAFSPATLKTLGQTITGQFPRQITTTPPVTQPAPGRFAYQAPGGGGEQARVSVEATVRSGIPAGGGSPSQISSVADTALRDLLAQQLIDLEAKLDQIPGISLSDEEREAFLQKAIAQISPYYDKKKAEIENGIKTGKIRTAEDILLNIRDVVQESEDLLKKYDIEVAKTEEQFVDQMANITALEGENLDTLRFNWKTRVKNAQQGQVEKQILTSGIGQKEVAELLGRQAEEETAVGRRAEQARTEAGTTKKYDLQSIAAARESVERERVRRIGGPTAEAETTRLALGTAGIPSMAGLPSRAEIGLRRGLEPTTIYRPEALTELGEERKLATESRKLQLEAEERRIREQRFLSEQRAKMAGQAATLRTQLYG